MKIAKKLFSLAFFALAAVFSLFFFGNCGLSALAAEGPFEAVLDVAEGRELDTVELTVSYNGSLGPVGAFLLSVQFDPERFECVSVRKGEAVREDYADSRMLDREVRSAYVQRHKGSPLHSGEVFIYRFQVLKDAPAGECAFSVSSWDMVDPDAAALDTGPELEISFALLPPLSEEAFLASLTPSDGVLEPSFSPDCFDYTLRVPFEVTSITFDAQAAEGATYRVNRKNLGAGGSDTLFKLAVTAEDGETKAEYRVTVHREEKASPAPTDEPTPKPTGTPKPRGTASPKPAAAVSPSSTPAPTATPVPEAAVTPGGENTTVQQTVVNQISHDIIIRQGSSSLLPGFVCILLFVAFLWFSKPLSEWLVKHWKNRK